MFQTFDCSFFGKYADFTGGIPEPRAVCTLDGTGYYVDSYISDGVIVELRLKRIDEE